MKPLHPIRLCIANLALIVLFLGVIGCKSTSSGVGNPFLAPDRVPPPSTHALLPGQAQPYYQGDPLPTASQAPVTPAAAVASKGPQTTLSPSGRTLAWNAPATAAPVSSPAPPAASATPATPADRPPVQTIAAVSEASVAVPTDTDPLRFALPQSPRVETPPSPAPTAAVAAPSNPLVAQRDGTKAVPSLQNVLLASYNTPPAGAPQPSQPVTPVAAQQPAAPWRSPQLIQPLNSPAYNSQQGLIQPLAGSLPSLPPPSASPLAQQPVAIPTNTMAATLRAVTPPAPTLGDPMPRIRMPDYLPPPPVTTADGFRPRTSMQ